ncbi:hypothetical protein C4J81_11350 [Deltaproteobacteria bacterium Smac51]|nr:hypothetical protein C4J81_11350 [Deltaproteobacteria bacterium Smac51]
MFQEEHYRPIIVDHQKAERLLPIFWEDYYELEAIVETFRRIYARCKSNIDDTIHEVDVTNRPDLSHQINQSVGRPLSSITRLYWIMGNDELVTEPLWQLEQTTDRLIILFTMLAEYLKHFENLEKESNLKLKKYRGLLNKPGVGLNKKPPWK